MKNRVIHIEGMTCNHCVMAVKKELGRIPTLVINDVRIGCVSVAYEESNVTEAQIQAAIEEAGYRVAS